MSTHTVPTRKLTSHQAEVFDRLVHLSGTRGDWIHVSVIGSEVALDHIVEKGHAVKDVQVGPRGGEVRYYRPAKFGPSIQVLQDAEVPSAVVKYFASRGIKAAPSVAEVYYPEVGFVSAQRGAEVTIAFVRRAQKSGATLVVVSGDAAHPSIDFTVAELLR